jgi:hypothetical protein
MDRSSSGRRDGRWAETSLHGDDHDTCERGRPAAVSDTAGDDGDVILGLEGFPWHTHGDLLVGSYGASQEAAIERLVDDLVHNRSVIAIDRQDGTTSDVCITDDPQADLRYKLANESIEFRHWDSAPQRSPGDRGAARRRWARWLDRQLSLGAAPSTPTTDTRRRVFFGPLSDTAPAAPGLDMTKPSKLLA